MRYEVIASRGEGQQLVLAEKRPRRSLKASWRGFLYTPDKKALTIVGPEVFKFGYWEPAKYTVDVPDGIKVKQRPQD